MLIHTFSRSSLLWLVATSVEAEAVINILSGRPWGSSCFSAVRLYLIFITTCYFWLRISVLGHCQFPSSENKYNENRNLTGTLIPQVHKLVHSLNSINISVMSKVLNIDYGAIFLYRIFMKEEQIWDFLFTGNIILF